MQLAPGCSNTPSRKDDWIVSLQKCVLRSKWCSLVHISAEKLFSHPVWRGCLNIQMPASINHTAFFTSHGKSSLHIQLRTARPGGTGHHSKSEYWLIWFGKDGNEERNSCWISKQQEDYLSAQCQTLSSTKFMIKHFTINSFVQPKDKFG